MKQPDKTALGSFFFLILTIVCLPYFQNQVGGLPSTGLGNTIKWIFPYVYVIMIVCLIGVIVWEVAK